MLAYLLKKTDLQITYNFNMVAIVNKAPQQLGLKAILEAYIAHQREVVTHRTQFDLERAEDRAHVLEGLVKALNILDEVIAAIKASKNRQDAQNNLVWMFGFSERQADSILTLQLYRLTNLEITSLQKELDEMMAKITHLRGILESDKKLVAVIRKELLEIRDKYGIDRRSLIQGEVEELKVSLEALVNAEDVLVALSADGYIKRTSMLSFTRSGGERHTSGVKEGDHIVRLLDVNTRDSLLVFTRKGQYFLLPVHQIPEFKWKEPGTAIVNVIGLSKGDGIVSVIPVNNLDDPQQSLVFVTRRGQVKRTELKEYSTSRSGAVAACKVAEGDEIITVASSTNAKDIVLVTREGMSIRFHENEVNPMGRVASGVRGIQLREGDEVISCFWVSEDEGEILAISDIGYAKRSLLVDYPSQSRGGKGMPTFEFKEGKRIRPNGSRLAGAFYCKEPLELNAVTRENAHHTFSSESAPLGERRSTGKQIVAVEKKDEIINLFPSVH